MGMWKYTLLLCVSLVLALSMFAACGDDDDDDDGGGGGYTCADACSVIYDDCGAVLAVDGYTLSEAECVEGCNDEGGIGSCETACLDTYAEDEDCDAFADCAYNCF
ncbi:MAG: hypothetical protein P9L99_09685 [Candidatus Lernaella stagnicola]|nr:hypothetical protein [Candidatus Lernaella stagnicola]